ncbi:hypothetical protein GZH47_09760 [Paenibacillus rhizovicinus]|uniref:Uncharacterized protein n=1 Tax=Paenibacillus rhizovicinus TaxID=2704463 RepID=A0A6C0P381_9BACL|nr:NHL repeat-containing protein [Paenibacillus rhizovicinus]QHW31112.1 hypothetical protein GZH47_09760 [Paenibacillus rhizovicinus]
MRTIVLKARSLLIGIGAAALLVASPAAAAADQPYEGYNYSYWQKSVPSPNAYLPSSVIDGVSLGAGALKLPGDLFVGKDNRIYVLDSGNNRILVLNEQFKLEHEIKGFANGGKQDTFNNPQGIFVTSSGHIYVADTDNGRIVELDGAGMLVRVIGPPKSEILPADFRYAPIKVALDRANRMYVIGRGVTDGMMEFDMTGTFNAFMGAPRVSFNPVDLFWKEVSTKAQRDKMIQFIPTEFNNLEIDGNGFIYVTTQTKSAAPIQKLNPTGINILKANGAVPPIGDVQHRVDEESQFTDISAGEHGIYHALDTRKGRIFTYDEEGHLLYVFGQRGEQAGTFRTPAAIDSLGDDILVLDRDQSLITLFKPTPFGEAVNKAVALHDDGKEEEARGWWNQVLRVDGNYELAYDGIGKSFLREGNYRDAMRYFKLGMDRTYYSKAFQLERKQQARRYFTPVMSVLVPLLVLLWLGPKVLRYGKRKWRRSDGKGGIGLDG